GKFRPETPRASFRGWLRAIFQHKFIDYLRRREGKPQAAGGTELQRWLLEVPMDETNAPSSGVVEAPDSFQQPLEQVRREVNERTWKAFWGVTVEGRSPADVAAELDLKPGAVYVAKSRVLRRLRETLRDENS